ncbi:hypothetical protein ACFFTM_07370 [Pseudoduganella plicata]|uniref:Uncharacterized protein n=1 Tax=Pseudoduganella plicata TaxID=321984 RepID=A0AA87Y1S7_9BURK|nr:hypothetical protein [Pseudoduganella plicata]GGY81534.1 hypothetical protein GCM10007388_12860 [Pseudoduganella plicata]
MATKTWHLPRVIAVGIAINIFILGLAVTWSGDAAKLHRLLVEDGIVEWMQFLCFAVLSGMLGFATVQRWQRQPGMRLEILALAGLTALVALAALEEISWFQRILHVESPEFFLQNNKQAETNLHNLAMGKESLHKVVLLKVIALVGLTHNIVLPLLARWRPGIRTWVESLGLYLPPLTASVIYLVLVALSHALIDHPRKGELGEMFGAVHYLSTVFAAYFIGYRYDRQALFENLADARRVSTLFAMQLAFLLLMAWMLSAGAGAGAYIAANPA